MFRSLYLSRETTIHRLDPRTKIVAFIAISVMLFTFNNPIYVAVIAVGLVGFGASARSLDNYIRMRYLLLMSFVVPTIAWQFYLSSPTTDHFWNIAPSRESLLYGLAAGLRYSSILMLGTLFGSTVTVEELMLGLIRLHVPYAIAFVFSLAMRLVPTFASVLATIIEAQIGRGLDLETRNPFKLARNFAPIILPFFVYAIRYSSLLSVALETRGFSLAAERTYLSDLKMRPIDRIMLVCLLGAMASCVLLRFGGHGVVIPGRL
jgi:energy-coupling factor transport system permease protein